MKLNILQSFSSKWFLISILILISIFISFSLPIKLLINFSDDDSYYYIKIALNFAKGLGSTFDGVNTTNGYHPLWFLVLAGYFKLLLTFGIEKSEVIYRFVFLLHFMLVILTSTILWNIIKSIVRISLQTFSFSILITLLSLFLFIRDIGMEQMLFGFLLSLFLLVKVKSLYENKFYFLPKIIIITLLCLTRIDSTFSIVYLLIIGDIITENHKLTFVEKIVYLLSPVLIFLLFGLFNYFNYGHFMLISSYYVNSFPNLNILNNIKTLIIPAERFSQLPKLIFFIVIFFYMIFKMIRERVKRNNFNYFLNYLSIGAFIYIMTHLIFNNFGLREWYLSIPMFIISLQLILLINTKKVVFQKLFFLIFLSLFLIVFYITRIKYLKYDAIYDYSKEIQSYVMPYEIIFTFDWMGVIGFFSERKVISGDGFANSYEYSHYLKNNKINEYLKKYNVDYYSTYSLSDIDENESFVVDSLRFDLYGLQYIKFPLYNLVIKMPYYYNHSTASVLYGNFYLFRIPKENL